mmetsp:Transcript_18598/g.46418  ORF Transcript_18598/g.46418 Transcript_18598/m.46418 type:complete len:291 (-) Transcript_18598:19-891(-)
MLERTSLLLQSCVQSELGTFFRRSGFGIRSEESSPIYHPALATKMSATCVLSRFCLLVASATLLVMMFCAVLCVRTAASTSSLCFFSMPISRRYVFVICEMASSCSLCSAYTDRSSFICSDIVSTSSASFSFSRSSPCSSCRSLLFPFSSSLHFFSKSRFALFDFSTWAFLFTITASFRWIAFFASRMILDSACFSAFFSSSSSWNCLDMATMVSKSTSCAHLRASVDVCAELNAPAPELAGRVPGPVAGRSETPKEPYTEPAFILVYGSFRVMLLLVLPNLFNLPGPPS